MGIYIFVIAIIAILQYVFTGPDTLELLVGTNVCNTLNMEAIKPVLTGYLWKLGGSGVIRSWKKRWFVLKHDNVLYYYKTNEVSLEFY